MSSTTRVRVPWLGGMLSVCLVAALVPDARCGGDTTHASPGTSGTAADLGLTVHEGLLSLKAQDASLKGLFEAIGQQLHLEVVARISADERITLACVQLSLAEALKRLRPSKRSGARGCREGTGPHLDTHRHLETDRRRTIEGRQPGCRAPHYQ